MARAGWRVGLALGCLVFINLPVSAQELRAQRHPLTAYLDLRPAPADAPAQSAPSWVEAFEFAPGVPTATAQNGGRAHDEKGISTETELGIDRSKSYFRVRLKHPPKASDHLQLRVLFDDLATGIRPRISVWNELGEKMMPATPLGQGLGVPSSETMTVYMNGVNYVEIEAPGDGSQVRGLFMSWLETAQVLQPSDFDSTEREKQPFGILPSVRTRKADTYYHGVVTARLRSAKPLVLKPVESPVATFEFELEHPPLLAVVSYEVLGAALDAPPAVAVNGHAQGNSEFHLPDLADPAFRGESREAESQMNFRYAGWIRAQKVIPGALLKAGLNNVSLALSNVTDSLAVRSVTIQLKYNWDKLDYDLTPAPSPHATP